MFEFEGKAEDICSRTICQNPMQSMFARALRNRAGLGLIQCAARLLFPLQPTIGLGGMLLLQPAAEIVREIDSEAQAILLRLAQRQLGS